MKGPVRTGLKQALLETLPQLQSADFDIRTQAEGKVKALEVTDEFAIHLCEILLEETADLGCRLMSSVLLKQYVDVHWSSDAENFSPPECPPATKEQVRQLLPSGLGEFVDALRASICYAISTIAHYDWPEYWGQLFDLLIQALKSNEAEAVDGAMRVLNEFTRDITENQTLQLVPFVLPEMYLILTVDSFSCQVKARAIQIFSTCITTLTSMAHLDKKIMKTHVYPVLPNFIKTFVTMLGIPIEQTNQYSVKIKALKCLTEIARNSPKCLQPSLDDILGPVWATVTNTADFYVKNKVNGSGELEFDADYDGEIYDLDTLVESLFEFVQALVESPKLRTPVRDGMEELIFYLIIYMQITEEQREGWMANPDNFVVEGDDETFAYGVRISALEVLTTLYSEFEDDCIIPMCSAVTRQLTTASGLRSAQDPNWWKLNEASMNALQIISDLITNHFRENKLPPQFNLTSMLEKMMIEDMNLPGADPFLVGRCLVLASKFSCCLSRPASESYLSMTVTALQSSQPAVLRISAVRALSGFCNDIRTDGRLDPTSTIRPYLGTSLDGLIALASEATPEALCLCMAAIALLVSLDTEFTASVESKVTPLAIFVFLKHNNDTSLVCFCQDIFKELSKSQACSAQLQHKLLPTLIEILVSPPPSAMHAVALDVLTTVVRFSDAPLSDSLMNQAFPACINHVLATDDITSMQNGGECLRAFVYNGYPQLLQWRNEQGQTGMHLVLQVCEHLMDPKVPESAAAFVGRLVSTVVTRGMGDLGQDGIERLLRAVLSKLLHTQTCSVTQNLILVFARLVHTDLGALLTFLTSVPGPKGESALAFVLTEWCTKQSLFFGTYETKVTILALSKLIEHALNENDERLLSIMVKGDEIVDSNSIGPTTRLQTAKKPIEWTEIPVIVKMYKLILRELFQQSEEAWEDQETDSEAEEESPTGPNILSALNPNMADIYRGYENGEYGDCDDEDPERQNDVLYRVDMKVYLKGFLENILRLPCYSKFSQHHSSSERAALAAMGFMTEGPN